MSETTYIIIVFASVIIVTIIISYIKLKMLIAEDEKKAKQNE